MVLTITTLATRANIWNTERLFEASLLTTKVIILLKELMLSDLTVDFG